MHFRFVAGKGGVGKTTLAAARAVSLAAPAASADPADRAGTILVVSTDPAHSLADALSSPTGNALALDGEPREVLPRLLAAELAAAPAYSRWLGERRSAFQTLAERGTYLAPDDIARLLDLPVPGVDELVGLLELMRLARESGCSQVIVDTAPTAHTLRLLGMPAALERLAAVLAALQERHRAVAEALSGRQWQGDDADAVADALAGDARALGELVRDPERARFTWVLLPEALSLAESEDALAALREAGAHVDELVVNRLAREANEECGACERRRRAEAAALRRARDLVPAGARLLVVPEVDEEPRGERALRALEALRREADESDFVEPDPAAAEASPDPAEPAAPSEPGESLEPPAWLDTLAPPARRLLLLGGKGGVGKTTCAAAVALLAARARPDRPILLLSTDPAHSLGDALEADLSDEPAPVGASTNLRARELDAPAAFARLEARYRDALESAFAGLARSGGSSAGIDAPLDRAVVERLFEATPPGLDELVALSELTDLAESEDDATDAPLMVVDTAPTGHALRLLELPEIALEWDHALLSILLEYREAVGLPAGLAGELVDLSKRLKRLRALLADPARCGFAVVTREGALPLAETRRLVARLTRAPEDGGLGVAVPAVIVNAVPDGDCSRCRSRAAAVDEAMAESMRESTREPGETAESPRGPAAILTAPAEYPPPRGPRALERWAKRWSRMDPARRA